MQRHELQQAVVHLDLDGLEDIGRAHGWTFDASGAERFFHGAVRRAADVFDSLQVPVTWFVVGQHLANLERRSVLRDLVSAGHAVASHTTTHRALPALSRDEKRREILESRARIQEQLRSDVSGFRAPGFHVDQEVLDLVVEAGYRYDSSLFADAGAPRGLRAASASLHWRLTPGSPTIELPLPPHRPLPFPFHPSYSLVLGDWYFRLGSRLARRTAQPLVLLFHLTDFADGPTLAMSDVRRRLYTLAFLDGERKAKRCAAMIERVRLHYRIVSTADLLDHGWGLGSERANGMEDQR